MRVGAFCDDKLSFIGPNFLRHQGSIVHVAARKCSEQQRFAVRRERSGEKSASSPLSACSFVAGCGVPPPSLTRRIPELNEGA